jgi:hypothetical protein
MTSQKDAGPSRTRNDLPKSARAVAEELVLTLTAAVNELNEIPQTVEDAKARHELILINARSLSLLVAVEEKLEKRIQTDGGGEGCSELRLDAARTEIAKRIARLAAAGQG